MLTYKEFWPASEDVSLLYCEILSSTLQLPQKEWIINQQIYSTHSLTHSPTISGIFFSHTTISIKTEENKSSFSGMPRSHSLYVYLQHLNCVRRCLLIHANFLPCVLDILLIALNFEGSIFENELALVESSLLSRVLLPGILPSRSLKRPNYALGKPGLGVYQLACFVLSAT